MREFVPWAVVLAFLLAAFHSVHVRRDVNRLGRELGTLERTLLERVRVADNLRLEWEQLVSPRRLARRAEQAGISIMPAGEGLR